ncbi:MAG TPA: hypothetical protein VLC92_16125 [Rhodocyclaceae bacterium]|nr:hypothetical protein [Rhodocyclaceae bacterium]
MKFRKVLKYIDTCLSDGSCKTLVDADFHLWGARGSEFESRRPDHLYCLTQTARDRKNLDFLPKIKGLYESPHPQDEGFCRLPAVELGRQCGTSVGQKSVCPTFAHAAKKRTEECGRSLTTQGFKPKLFRRDDRYILPRPDPTGILGLAAQKINQALMAR